MVGRLLSFCHGLFSEAMLVSGRVYNGGCIHRRTFLFGECIPIGSMSNQTTSLMSWKHAPPGNCRHVFSGFLSGEDVFNLSVQSASMKSIVKSWWRNPGISAFAVKSSYVFVQRYISGSRCWRAFVHVNIQGQMRSFFLHGYVGFLG